MTNQEIQQEALEYAKKNKIRIARELTDKAWYIPDVMPISVFMAGSPGAGKTEFSKNLIGILEKTNEHHVIRIDADEIRPRIPKYDGNNSYLFQGAISLIVEKMHDLALHNRQTFVFDSTLAQYDKAIENINRSLKKKRHVSIFYVYQIPEVAWKFTKAREITEGRNIPKTAFIERFLGAEDTIRRIRKEYGKEVDLFLVKKDFEKNTTEYIEVIEPNGKLIDDYITYRYTKGELEKLL